MVSSELWLQVLSWTKALFDAVKSGEDVFASYQKHRQEKDTIEESRRVSKTFSTYTENEVKSILARLEGCRDRYIKHGGGKDRSNCLCSILNEGQRRKRRATAADRRLGQYLSPVELWCEELRIENLPPVLQFKLGQYSGHDYPRRTIILHKNVAQFSRISKPD